MQVFFKLNDTHFISCQDYRNLKVPLEEEPLDYSHLHNFVCISCIAVAAIKKYSFTNRYFHL